MRKYIISTLTIFSVAAMLSTSCNKMLEIKPEDVLLAEDALKSKEDMQKLLNSCYDALANQFNGTVQSYNDLMSDDVAKPLRDDLGFKTEIWNRNTNFFNSDVGGLYNRLYIPVYRVNSMDQFYDVIPDLTAGDKIRMQAEGKFIRALCHFELVRLWAQPYGYTSDNSHPGIVIRDKASQDPKGRSTVGEVYSFILSDLQFAIANLPDDNGNYADKNAARALLAKVYVQMNKRTDAIPLLNEVINSGKYTFSNSLNRFDNAAASSEYVFTFISTNASTDNRAGEFIGKYRSDNKVPEYGISSGLYALINSDTTDRRKTLVNVVNPGKDNEYFTTSKFNYDFFSVPYINLTELMITRAELLAEGNTDLSTAISDINKIIGRAYADSTTKMLPSNAMAGTVLTEVRKQRRLELFCEGERVQHLKRLGAKGEPNVFIRSADWNCDGLALQFPATERTSLFVFNPTGGCN